MSEPEKKSKRTLFEEWIQGEHILVHLDSRVDGVSVPANLADNPGLTLKLSYFFQGSTEHDDSGITAYLKFSGQYERCHLPWKAIWGFTSSGGEQFVWPEDFPKEILLQVATSKIREAGKKLFGIKGEGSGNAPEKRAALSDVSKDVAKPSKKKEKPKKSDKDDDTPDGKGRSFLKRIK